MSCEITPDELGLAGAVQLCRIDTTVDHVRGGQVFKTTESVRFVFTSLYPDEASPDQLLKDIRGYWGIENGQHYRRDVAQNEDKCGVRRTRRAQNISVLRSLVDYLFERRKASRGAPRSLPKFHARNHRTPRWAIERLMGTDTAADESG